MVASPLEFHSVPSLPNPHSSSFSSSPSPFSRKILRGWRIAISTEPSSATRSKPLPSVAVLFFFFFYFSFGDPVYCVAFPLVALPSCPPRLPCVCVSCVCCFSAWASSSSFPWGLLFHLLLAILEHFFIWNSHASSTFTAESLWVVCVEADVLTNSTH